MSEIVGVLLAAGLGTRYDPRGECLKLLQPVRKGRHAGAPVVVAAARNLRPAVGRVVAVVRPRSDPHQAQLQEQLRSEGCEVLVCDRAAEGMGTSLAHGIRASGNASAWIVALGDMPAIDPATIRSVADALRAGHTTAALAYRGRRGHPVGFSAQCQIELLQSSGDAGARAVLETFPPHLIDVDDDGILIDIDFR